MSTLKKMTPLDLQQVFGDLVAGKSLGSRVSNGLV